MKMHLFAAGTLSALALTMVSAAGPGALARSGHRQSRHL